ncbi:MAG: DUF885 domain-containing protein [Rubrivivax sp.]
MTDTLHADAALRALADAEWRWRLAEFPRLATLAGEHAHDHRLERMGPASLHARAAHWRAVLAQLDALPASTLGETAQVEHAVLRHQVQVGLWEIEHGGAWMPIDGDQSFYSYLGDLWREQPTATADELERYVGRLAAIPAFFDDHVQLLRDARRRGLVAPALVLQGRDAPLRPVAEAADPEATPFYAPLASRFAAHPALAAQARRVIERRVQPAYRALLAFLRDEVLPHGRDSTAAHALPGGEAFYATRLQGFTTRPLTPAQVHEMGLAEVERIGDELRRLQADCGHAGSLADFLAALRADPRHYPKSGDELLAAAAWIAKRVDGQLARFFGRLPRQPFGIEPVPEAFAPYYTSGRYVPAPVDGEQPALYWVNTHRLESRALYALPALTLHEAVPGHHLQFALTAEDASLAPWRRWDATLSAHTEGWALYAEFLGQEMGLYRTPFEQVGRASYEMWRACRLVIDTGLHCFGWSRERARGYLRAHTALSEHEIATEVDRYIGWPGQALSYKVGEIGIRALRARLERAQGARFSLRGFHDRLLALGPMPLPALDRVMGPAAPA